MNRLTWKLLVLISLAMWLGCNSNTTPPVSQPGKQTAVAEETPTELTVYGSVPQFQFTDQNEELFDSSTLDGRVWLANFFFTTCPSTCPIQTREIALLQQKVEGVELVSITVQPEADTPDVLLRYAEQYQADLSRWHFLTGDRESIWKLSKTGFMLAVGEAPEPSEMPIFHSSKIILVDGQQQIRGFYESQSRAEMDKLARDLARLVAENDNPEDDELELEQLQSGLEGAFDGAN